MELAVAKTNIETPPRPKLNSKAKEDYYLVQSAIEGCQRAYAALMDRYQKPIHHKMYDMVHNRDDADDLTLEAFGKAFNKLHSYAPNFAFSTWLFKIAINNCIDHIRKKRLQYYSIDELIEPNSGYDYANNLRANIRNPEDEMMRDQRISMVGGLVPQLGDKYRQMIELRFYEEMSYEEIANKLEIPLGTVKAQLYRAKESLYGMLTRPGPSAYLDSTRRRK